MELKYIHLPLLFFFIPGAFTLKCYSCSQGGQNKLEFLSFIKGMNDDCGDYDDSLLTMCIEPMDACITVIGEDRDGKIAKISDCGTVQGCENINGTVSNGVSIQCVACSTDGCNSSPAVGKLSCYDCEEGASVGNNTQCGDFSNTTIKVCPDTADACIRIETEIDGSAAVYHSCGIEKSCGDLDGETVAGVSVTCKSCHEDLCNKYSELKCYECTNGTLADDRFRDLATPCGAFDNSLLKTCPPDSHVCIAVTGHLGNREATAFSCGTTVEACQDLDGEIQGGVKIECNSCLTNKCNKYLS